MNGEQKHLIMGTAGHVDHGKTALVKALTGIECDTHPEEKQRGITINLGFANLSLDSGNTLSVIDVPGHKDFIHTMVSGACGIDFVLMVISADSGIMPQTREHLQIMEMLNIAHGVIVLTKVDLVDEETIILAQEEILDLVEGTFLAHAPLIPVSVKTGFGLDKLRTVLDECCKNVQQRPTGELFRMFIDRIFSVAGFGTVLTGSVLSGSLQVTDPVYVLPPEKKLKIRRFERHGKEVNQIIAGDRASINIVGLTKEEYRRGMALCNLIVSSTTQIDAQITLFKHAPRIRIWSEAIFILGTYEAKVRVHLLNANTLTGGECAVVQIHLPTLCTVCIGDRFILRNTSKDATLGGGEALDPHPLHHRRRTKKLITQLQKVAQGDMNELVAVELRKTRYSLSSSMLAMRLKMEEQTIIRALETNELPPDIVCIEKNHYFLCILRKNLDEYEHAIVQSIEKFHSQNPLEDYGRSFSDLKGCLYSENQASIELILEFLLNSLIKKSVLKFVNATYALNTHSAQMTTGTLDKIALIESYVQSFGLKVPLPREIEVHAKKNGIEQKELNHILRYLTGQKKIFRVESDYIHAHVVNPIRIQLLHALQNKSNGMTVAEFRNMISDNRKICLCLFNLFDSEGITERVGDCRCITLKGQEYLKTTRL